MTLSEKSYSDAAGFGYTLATGRLFCPFPEFHEWCERLVGQPIWTHEFANANLWRDLRERFEREAKTHLDKGDSP